MKGSPDLYVGSFYKPPKQTEDECLIHLEKSIHRIRQSENSHLWLGGDFNLGGIDWDTYSTKPKAQNTKQCKQLLDICQDNYIEQVVTSPTHITTTSQSTLDLFFTSNSSLVNKTEIIPGISDHEIVYVESSLKSREVKKPPRKIYLYNKANTENIKESIKNIDMDNQNTSTEQNIDNIWNTFRNNVLDIMNDNIPSKMINNSKKRLPWINKSIKSLIRKRNKLFKRMKQHKNSKTTQHYKDTKHLLQKEMRKAYWDYLEHIICYDENVETPQKQKNSGTMSVIQKRTAQALHL